MIKTMNKDAGTGRWSWKYAVIKFLAKISFHIYYPRLHVTGTENIPSGGRIIFAANHRNALMDALAILLTNHYQPVFLARADIFSNPLTAGILRFLKIIPVYRLTDGVDSMGYNESTFENTVSVLNEGGCIGIMPEGNQEEMKRLRKLKKGIFRIAFRAAGDAGKEPEVKIIPVGLDYTDISEFFGGIVVNYGKPLHVSSYAALFKQHHQKGYNAMKDDLARELSRLMIDIKDRKNYEKDELLVKSGSRFLIEQNPGEKRSYHRKFLTERAVCQALYEYYDNHPDKAEELRIKSERLLELMTSYGISPEYTVSYSKARIFLFSLVKVVAFPFFLAGFMVHLLPVAIIHLVLRKLKDRQFISSFKYILGTLLVPLNYIIAGFFAFSHMHVHNAVIFILLMPLSGVLSCRISRFAAKLKKNGIFNSICLKDREFASKFSAMKSDLINEMGPVLKTARSRLDPAAS